MNYCKKHRSRNKNGCVRCELEETQAQLKRACEALQDGCVERECLATVVCGECDFVLRGEG